jgi:hypothetical protein
MIPLLSEHSHFFIALVQTTGTALPPSNTKMEIPPSSFPFKLHRLLDDAENCGFDEIVSWMATSEERGARRNAFRVHKPKEFARLIMPRSRYFPRSSKYRSFQRQLNIWCFERIESGPHHNAYHHPLFVRGCQSLCEQMVRIKVKKQCQQLLPAVGTPTCSTNTRTSACNGAIQNMCILLQGSRINQVVHQAGDEENNIDTHTPLFSGRISSRVLLSLPGPEEVLSSARDSSGDLGGHWDPQKSIPNLSAVSMFLRNNITCAREPKEVPFARSVSLGSSDAGGDQSSLQENWEQRQQHRPPSLRDQMAFANPYCNTGPVTSTIEEDESGDLGGHWDPQKSIPNLSAVSMFLRNNITCARETKEVPFARSVSLGSSDAGGDQSSLQENWEQRQQHRPPSSRDQMTFANPYCNTGPVTSIEEDEDEDEDWFEGKRFFHPGDVRSPPTTICL